MYNMWFFDRFPLFRIMFSSNTHAVSASILHSFFCYCQIIFYILFIHSSVGGHWLCFFKSISPSYLLLKIRKNINKLFHQKKTLFCQKKKLHAHLHTCKCLYMWGKGAQWRDFLSQVFGGGEKRSCVWNSDYVVCTYSKVFRFHLQTENFW